MNDRWLAVSILALAIAVASHGVFGEARAQDDGPGMLCEDGFFGAAGVKREKLYAWMQEQHAAGRRNFLPFGVQGTVRNVCAW